MTEDGMTPTITITDPAVAFAIAEALRSSADAKRRVADRLASPAYMSVSAANARTAARLIMRANMLDTYATECERQGIAAESAHADTVLIPVCR